jgi:high affinity Mn2+ porin
MLTCFTLGAWKTKRAPPVLMRLRIAQFGPRITCLLVAFSAAGGPSALAQSSGPDSSAADNSVFLTLAAPQDAALQAQSQPQNQPQNATPASDADLDSPLTLFPHSETARYWISGQANIVFQWHPSFIAAYSGPHSFRPVSESATSRVLTLYTGYELTPTTELYLDIESSGGHGLSDSVGMAGYPDLDVVRVGLVSQTPYIARAMIREVIPLSGERVTQDRGATTFTLAPTVPARRIEIRAGKFSLVDFFDTNTYGSDSHLQFLNWATADDAAYDYAANTRGYTDGAMIEYDDHWFSARFAVALMPKVANGIYLDADIARARAENLEFDVAGNRIRHRPGVFRLLVYLNQADMGNYEASIREYLEHQTPTPDITATRQQGRRRYGFLLNGEQEIVKDIGVFGRLGWSNGRNESFAYTECDRTAEGGAFSQGTRWGRRDDRAGVAVVANGIVAAHQEYLALGGLGFQLGDGALSYGLEKIVEGFYTTHVWRGVFVSYDVQHVSNPGYNTVRGPVLVSTGRLHVDF